MKRDVGWTYSQAVLKHEFVEDIEGPNTTYLNDPKRALGFFHRYLRDGKPTLEELFFAKQFHYNHLLVFCRRRNLEAPEFPPTWLKRIDREIERRRRSHRPAA
jgi:hypothetical protein